MKGRSTDIAHSRRVGKNWVMTGLWSRHRGKRLATTAQNVRIE